MLYDGGLCPAVEALARNIQRQRGIRVTLELDAAAEPEAEQVRVLLFEAVRELLTNVVTHAKATTANIRISLNQESQIEITVRDDGIGFGPLAIEFAHRKDKLFGLMEIRERLKYIGGGMRLEKAAPRGAQVTLFVPTELRRIDPSTALQKTALTGATVGAPQASPQVQQLKGRCRIVVADDHAIFREGLINLISQDADFQVVGEAADGEEAIAIVTKVRPDILICDVSMPKLSGIEVTARLSRAMPELTIVGLSMHERQDMSLAMRKAGAAAYVTKGGSSDALMALLRGLAAQSSAATPQVSPLPPA